MNFLKTLLLFLFAIVIWVSWLIYVNIYGTWGGQFDFGKLGDSFGIINALVGTFTLIFLGATYFHQKETLDEQTKGIRNQNFRNFIEFLLEGLNLSISNIQVRGHNQFYGVVRGESALLGLKYGGVLYEGMQFSNIDKDSWLKHAGLIKLKEIIKSISYIESYIEENYRSDNKDRKDFYYSLVKDRISYNLYELIIENPELKGLAEKTITIGNYLS